MKHRPILTERQEEILSYMTGLAPVGQPFQVRHKWLLQDFNWMDHSAFHKCVRTMIDLGCVECVAIGRQGDPNWYRVMIRPEQCIVGRRRFVQSMRRQQMVAA